MNIQYIGFNHGLLGEDKRITKSYFGSPKDFDDFDLNFIDLNDSNIWENMENYRYFESKNEPDFATIGSLTKNTKKNVIISMPKNDNGDWILKNNISIFLSKLKLIYSEPIDLMFGITKTKINDTIATSDFVFTNYEGYDVLTKTITSDKTTTVKLKNIILTTINIPDYTHFEQFLIEIKIKTTPNIEIPEWMEEIKMFDDMKQYSLIESKEREIDTLKKEISISQDKINKNNRLKSVLFTQADELVEVVFEVLEELLGINLSEFEDKKIEDVSFEVSGKVFVGEIKGIKSNVKTSNLSQLDNHYTSFIENNDYLEENVYSILIINHQRNKPLSEREPIHTNQITVAREKYKSLIIETRALLELLEQYRESIISKEDILEMFMQLGLLRVKD